MTRQELQELALRTVSSELYHELANTVEDASEEDLQRIISFSGNYLEELAYQDEMERA